MYSVIECVLQELFNVLVWKNMPFVLRRKLDNVYSWTSITDLFQMLIDLKLLVHKTLCFISRVQEKWWRLCDKETPSSRFVHVQDDVSAWPCRILLAYISSFPVAELKTISSIALPPVSKNLSIFVGSAQEADGSNDPGSLGLTTHGATLAFEWMILLGGLDGIEEHEPIFKLFKRALEGCEGDWSSSTLATLYLVVISVA